MGISESLDFPVSGLVKDRVCTVIVMGWPRQGTTDVTEKDISSGREKSIASETPPALTGPGAS